MPGLKKYQCQEDTVANHGKKGDKKPNPSPFKEMNQKGNEI
jgi:hypothetical protein